jgi:hypothetical protein
MHQDDMARTIDPAKTVVIIVDRGIELSVAAQRDQLHHVALLRRDIDIGGQRCWRNKIGLAGLCFPLALARAERPVKATWLPKTRVEVVEDFSRP